MENYQNTDMLTTAEGMEQTGTSSSSRKKQKLILAAVLVICMAIFATGTLAFFTAEETAKNVITTGVLSMDLVEETTGGEPWPEGGVSGVMPGMEVDKVPYVVNDGGVEFYARMAVAVKVTGADGKELSAEYVSLNIDTANWTEKDGFYYYNGTVAAGAKSAPLFTKVIFDKEMPNEYMNARVEVDVYASVVQSKNNGDSALTAAGWKESK